MSVKQNGAASDPVWYKDAIFYELRVRSFYDGNGDGIGDFPGLTAKLDYLQSLGVTTLWLLPFYPSPMRDDGYDIADYTNVHPVCGTLRDFKIFVREAHRRDLKIVTELVLNHTSDLSRMVSTCAAFTRRQYISRFLCLERNAGTVPGGTGDLSGLRAFELGVGPGGQVLLLASILLASAGLEL